MKFRRFYLNIVFLIFAFGFATNAQETRPKVETKIAYRELKSYRNYGNLYRNILVNPKITRAEIIELARALHAAAPQQEFQLFTDDARFDDFVKAEIERPPRYLYPSAWADTSFIATIKPMPDATNKMRWQLLATQWQIGQSLKQCETDVIADLN